MPADAADAVVRQWCAAGVAGLDAARAEIDALNVYPVPDGDTGTNLVLTMRAAAAALTPAGTGPGGAATELAAMAAGALVGARGNSGVILSSLLRGLAEVFGPGCAAESPGGGAALSPGGGAALLAAGLARAVELGYAAVAVPVEGTMLTVARAAAAGAADPAGTEPLAVAARAAAVAARAALRHTPEQLPVLARAGVVDAGGAGLCVLLDALAAVTAHGAPSARDGAGHPTERAVVAGPGPAASFVADRPPYAYEVQYLLDAEPAAVPALRAALAGLGDSLVISGTGHLWSVHVHVDDVGAAIEAGLTAGRPRQVSVARFADPPGTCPQHLGDPAGRVARTVLVLAPDAGLEQLFTAAGALVVPAGGPLGRPPPSAGELVAVIRASGAAEVVVLAGDGPARAAAAATAASARAAGLTVALLPTRSPMQGLAALAVHDPQRRFEEDVVAMTAAAGATRVGAVTVATEAAQTSAGVCAAGDVLALLDGDVVLLAADLRTAACGLLERLLLGGGELVTMVAGPGAPVGLTGELAAYVASRWPGVETTVHAGGQPDCPLLLGVE